MLHALGILHRAEEVYLLVGGVAEGFHALVALLTVVEARSHAMDAQEGVFNEGWRAPLAGGFGVVGFNVAVDCMNY